jgi:hypothetical protein
LWVGIVIPVATFVGGVLSALLAVRIQNRHSTRERLETEVRDVLRRELRALGKARDMLARTTPLMIADEARREATQATNALIAEAQERLGIRAPEDSQAESD